jgi:Endonuclease/Exonuclease/phosphatase family
MGRNPREGGGLMGLRLATWNIEWANALFDDEGALLNDAGPSARHETTRAQQIAGIVAVLQALDADGLMVVEAPDTNGKRSTARALQALAAHAGVRAQVAVTGFPSDSEQEIAFLFDPARLTAAHTPRTSGPFPRFDGTQRANGDAVTFSKPPLELAVQFEDKDLRLIGVHVKSKAPHGARDAADAIRIARANRVKQLAQCRWLRGRVADHLERGESLVVLGDFNDGPGLDEYEVENGASGVEVVMGKPPLALTDPAARMALSRKLGARPTTSRFWLAEEERYFEALLDFIMVSPDLAEKRPRWRIWHPFDEPAALPLQAALLAASDHFPVTIDLP